MNTIFLVNFTKDGISDVKNNDARCFGRHELFHFCGGAQSPSSRIIDGTISVAEDWPYMTALVNKGVSAYYGQFCGGSYIGENYILTAAHCVDNKGPDDLDVVVGIHQLSLEGSQGARIEVEHIFIHPDYDSNNLVNDIAILRLSRPPTSSEASAVEYADALTRQTTPDYTTLTVAGWGNTVPIGTPSYPDQLLEVDVGLSLNTIARMQWEGQFQPV